MSTALIPRATIDEVYGQRCLALQKFAEAFDALAQAREAAKKGALSTLGADLLSDEALRHLVPRYLNDNNLEVSRTAFLEEQRKTVDRAIWRHLINTTELEQLFDRQAREQFNHDLDKDPPEPTPENALATIESLLENSGLMLRRGIANAFSKLDRRFRSHDGFKIGSRIILSHCFTEYASWNYTYYSRETIRDIERAFHILDGKPFPPDYAGIIGQCNRLRLPFEAETEYFKLKAFKNGNAHLWFKRDDLVAGVNRLLAEYYGAALGAGSDSGVAEDAAAHVRSNAVAKNLGFFETPKAVCEQVVDAANLYSFDAPLRVLEPSAGRGALARAVRDARTKVSPGIHCVELDYERSKELKAQGFETTRADFLLCSPEELGMFDRVVMNPPFDRGLDIDHVLHALKFVKPGGQLVAIMSAGTEFREDRKTVAFRQICERYAPRGYGARQWRDLPPGSFAESGTMVNTLILTLHVPSM